MMTRLKLSVTGIFAIALVAVTSVGQAKDEQMLALANSTGCFICHRLAPGPSHEIPLAPSYQEIALRYKGDKGAYDRLLDRVMYGTAYREQAWAGKIGMRFMPPNVNITRDTGAALVHWILRLNISPELEQKLMHYDRMQTLSAVSGCTICHRMNPVTERRVIPLAPSFREIAVQYKDKANSRKKLVDSVVQGTQGKKRVWENVNMLFMPPNVAVKKDDAEDMVAWILSLDSSGIARRPQPPASRK
ncbi:MAG: hypothetical protein GY703_13305 [Gammaproteobacteria bacterium]|nr:hypothetical protein [Gammaproteobacteria bacterium]